MGDRRRCACGYSYTEFDGTNGHVPGCPNDPYRPGGSLGPPLPAEHVAIARRLSADLRRAFPALSADERCSIVASLSAGYCRSCWSVLNGPCHCENDE